MIQKVLLCFVLFFFLDRLSRCSPECPGTHRPASASLVLGLKVCATSAQLVQKFLLMTYIQEWGKVLLAPFTNAPSTANPLWDRLAWIYANSNLNGNTKTYFCVC